MKPRGDPHAHMYVFVRNFWFYMYLIFLISLLNVLKSEVADEH